MNHTVVWLPAAEQELARLWLDASDRDEIARAAREIDDLLGNDPEDAGESRSAGRRVLIAGPLAVIFRLLHDDRVVVVSHAWRFGKAK